MFHAAKALECAQRGHQCPWDGPGWCRIPRAGVASPFLWGRGHGSWWLWNARQVAAWLSGCWMLLNSSSVLERAPRREFSAGESPEAEVIYLCMEHPAPGSAAWPRVGKHPRLPAWDQLSWASWWLLTWLCAWRNCPKAAKAPPIHRGCLGQTGGTLAGDCCRWVTQSALSHGHASSCPSTWKGGFQNAGVFHISNGWSGRVSERQWWCLQNESKK